MVDDEVGRDERVHLGRIATQVRHRIAHDREVDHGRDAREVLEKHTCGHERDLGLGRDTRPPGKQGLDVVWADRAISGMAQQVLEQDLDRDRERGEVHPVADGRQPVITVVGAADPQRVARGERIGDRGPGWHDAPPSSSARVRGVSRRRAGAPAPGRIGPQYRTARTRPRRLGRYTRDVRHRPSVGAAGRPR